MCYEYTIYIYYYILEEQKKNDGMKTKSVYENPEESYLPIFYTKRLMQEKRRSLTN